MVITEFTEETKARLERIFCLWQRSKIPKYLGDCIWCTMGVVNHEEVCTKPEPVEPEPEPYVPLDIPSKITRKKKDSLELS